jgi:hypothetical protein
MEGGARALARAGARRRHRVGATFVAVLALAALSLLAPAGVTVASGDHAKARTAAVYNLARPRPPGPPPPHADFVWFPALPHPGEPALLASVSTASVSPIVKYAWDLRQGEGFAPGGPTLDTTFRTYAPRAVRLRVTDANGSSDIATHTISMSAPPPSVISPFPIVRIVGIVKRAGVRIQLLAVRLDAAARAVVACRGRRCPAKSQARALPAGRRGIAWVRFRRFERFLRAGVALEIRISKPGLIGSFTRYAIRRRKLPTRSDSCLDPGGIVPIACPPA